MHKQTLRWGLTLGIVAVCIVLGGTRAEAVQSNTRILASGSDATYYMNNALQNLYNESPGCNLIVPPGQPQPLDFTCQADIPGVTVKTENYNRDVLSTAPPIGGNNGIAQVCGNLSGVSFATSPRQPRPTDCTGLHFVAYARDGQAWECFGGCHGVTNLTKAQLQGIYGNCSITNWSQVGGTPGPIKVYAAPPGAGVRSIWLSYLGLSDDSACTPDSNHIVQQNSNARIVANGDQNDAIFYFAVSAWNYRVHGTDGSSIKSLEGITPTEAHILDGTYPNAYFATHVYCAASVGTSPCPKPANAPTKRYLHETSGWICKAAAGGQHTAKHGINPLTGNNFRKDIENTIHEQGYAPLPYGLTGGSASGSSFCREFDS